MFPQPVATDALQLPTGQVVIGVQHAPFEQTWPAVHADKPQSIWPPHPSDCVPHALAPQVAGVQHVPLLVLHTCPWGQGVSAQSIVPPQPSDTLPHLPVQAVAIESGVQQAFALHTWPPLQFVEQSRKPPQLFDSALLQLPVGHVARGVQVVVPPEPPVPPVPVDEPPVLVVPPALLPPVEVPAPPVDVTPPVDVVVPPVLVLVPPVLVVAPPVEPTMPESKRSTGTSSDVAQAAYTGRRQASRTRRRDDTRMGMVGD